MRLPCFARWYVGEATPNAQPKHTGDYLRFSRGLFSMTEWQGSIVSKVRGVKNQTIVKRGEL